MSAYDTQTWTVNTEDLQALKLAAEGLKQALQPQHRNRDSQVLAEALEATITAFGTLYDGLASPKNPIDGVRQEISPDIVRQTWTQLRGYHSQLIPSKMQQTFEEPVQGHLVGMKGTVAYMLVAMVLNSLGRADYRLPLE